MGTPSAVIPTASGLARRGVNIVEAAELLGSTAWFVETQIRLENSRPGSGLKAHKLGRAYTIFISDLDEYVDRRRRAATVTAKSCDL